MDPLRDATLGKPLLAADRVPARVATVRTQFNRRAGRFADHDALPREIATRLVDRLEWIRLQPQRILDIGCGAGAALRLLAARYPTASVVGLDLSESMLRRRLSGARERLPRWLGGARKPLLIGTDGAALPISADTVDLVFSNLMLHWHPAPHTVFPEWKRVLRVNGLLLFSCFGPDTLRELRAACRVALPHARPMPFIDLHDFGDMMVASGFSNPVMDAEIVTLTFASPHELLQEASALGGNPRDDRYSALPSGRQARSLLDALAAQRGDDGRIALSFEVAYGHAWKPEPRAAQDTISVEALRADLARRRTVGG